MKQIQLTIGILLSNRIQYIKKVMEGIKPLLHSLPCELIAIDTKGADSDGSIEIVKEYTDKIYPFEWCNDFSKARNLVFEYARGEWFCSWMTMKFLITRLISLLFSKAMSISTTIVAALL